MVATVVPQPGRDCAGRVWASGPERSVHVSGDSGLQPVRHGGMCAVLRGVPCVCVQLSDSFRCPRSCGGGFCPCTAAACSGLSSSGPVSSFPYPRSGVRARVIHRLRLRREWVHQLVGGGAGDCGELASFPVPAGAICFPAPFPPLRSGPRRVPLAFPPFSAGGACANTGLRRPAAVFTTVLAREWGNEAGIVGASDGFRHRPGSDRDRKPRKRKEETDHAR